MDGTSEQSVADSFQVFENTSPSQLESIVFDAEETSDSPFSELMPNQPKSNSMSGRTVKQYEEEMRVLKKENFNLKLRIYFLEERMQKLGKPLGEGDGAEKKLIELKVQMETLRRENQSKTVLLAQAGRAIEMMEEEHNAAMEKLRKDLESRPIASKPTENSMALYADAFDLPSSFLMPPPPPPAASVRNSKGKEQDSEALELMQKQIDDLEQKLQNVSEELVTSQERERQLTEALDSKTPEIQIKVQELCQKDKMLEDQRRIIVEIQIRLDEKQKELECLKQSLDLHQSTIFRIEADNRDLNAKLRESEEKQEASSLTIQTLIAKVKELHERRASAEKNLKSFKSDQIGEMHQEENEHLWTELECQRRQVERLSKENSDVLKEKAAIEAALHAEIAELKLQLERTKNDSQVVGEAGSTTMLMMGRLDELAAFLSTLLKRPHLLNAFTEAHRASLLQLVEQSWGDARQRWTNLSASIHPDHTFNELDNTNLTSMAADDLSLIGQIQAYLKGPEQEEFLLEVEAHKDKTIDFWSISETNDNDSGREIELARWSLEKQKSQSPLIKSSKRQDVEQDDDEEDEVGSGATAVERGAPGNHSESEAWSEPDRTVSMARIGLPENRTPVNQSVSSPASSELDHTPRAAVSGKKTSYKKLVQRLHTTEQINESLLAEVSGYKALLKSHSEAPPSPIVSLTQTLGLSANSEMIQELEQQRLRLEKMLLQNEAMRHQLDVNSCLAKGEEGISSLVKRLSEVQDKLDKANERVSELERLLSESVFRLKAVEAQLSERDQLHAQLQKVQQETQDALARMEKTKAAMQEEVTQTRKMCQQLEQKAQEATDRCHQLEEASKQDIERCDMLARQVEEAQQHCQLLTQQIGQMELAKGASTAASASANAEHSTANSTAPSSLLHLSDTDEVFNATGSVPLSVEDSQRHTLSSPDLGIESDTGRSLEGKDDEKGRLSQENWQLKQKLAESQRIMEKCLEALNKKNRDRQKVQASMEKQLLRTEEVLIKASRNLKLLPNVPKTP